MHRPIPIIAHAYGEVSSRNAPMLNASPLPITRAYHQDKVSVGLENRVGCGGRGNAPVRSMYRPMAESVVRPEPDASANVDTMMLRIGCVGTKVWWKGERGATKVVGASLLTRASVERNPLQQGVSCDRQNLTSWSKIFHSTMPPLLARRSKDTTPKHSCLAWMGLGLSCINGHRRHVRIHRRSVR